jgi:integrase
MPIHKLRAPDLDALYRQLGRDRVNVHTIRRIHEVLSAAFAKAVGWGYIDRNPAEHASPPPRPRSERQAVSAADLRALLDACPPKLKLWVRLAFVTGARRGEVCGLQWRDVNLERGTLVVRRNVVYTPASGVQVKETKTGKVHVVALDPETVRLLRSTPRSRGRWRPPVTSYRRLKAGRGVRSDSSAPFHRREGNRHVHVSAEAQWRKWYRRAS